MTVSYWQYTLHREPPLEVDLAVVGGGMLGVSTAFWWRRRYPRRRLVLLEAHELAYGASGRNAGFLLKGTDASYVQDMARYGAERARALWAFSEENLAHVQRELEGEAFDLHLPGSWKLAGTPEEWQELQESAEALQREGVEVYAYDARFVQERLGFRGFWGGLRVPGDGQVHSARLVRHIARRADLPVLEHHPVVGLAPHRQGWWVDTARRPVYARQVLLALNAYLPLLLPGTAQWVRPVRAQMLATAPGTASLEAPMTSHREHFYFRSLPDGTLLLGGCRHAFAGEEVGYADETTEAVQRCLETYITRHIASEPPTVRLRWSGTMGFSPDGLPRVAEVEPGLWWTGGYSGHGMSWGFRMGQLVARCLAGETDPYLRFFRLGDE